MPKESPAACPKPGNMDRMVFSEDLIGKRHQGLQRGTHQKKKRKRLFVCLFVCLFVGGEIIWADSNKPRAIEEAGSHGPEGEAGACPDPPIPSDGELRVPVPLGLACKALSVSVFSEGQNLEHSVGPHEFSSEQIWEVRSPN